MLVKTAELIGKPLDWAVTKCEYNAMSELGISIKPWVLEALAKGERFDPYSTDWLWGGPIIDRARISVFELPSGLDLKEHPTFKPGDLWEAEIMPHGEDSIRFCGPTPLVAVARCHAASKFGDEVEIPDVLVS